jgi:TonB-dependent receptor
MCITNAILDFHGVEFAYPDQFYESPSTTDVVEETFAGYLKANFSSEMFGKNVFGNFGVRVVNTEVTSTAFRTEYEIIEDNDGFLSIQPVPDAELERVSAGGDYTEWLPSVNVVMELDDEWLLRGGIFRSMSRADPSDMGYNRSFTFSSQEDITNPDDLIQSVSGSGNPFVEALMSWNYDASIEWYPNADTLLAFSLFYKDFKGGFEQIRTLETFTVDGTPITAPVTVSNVSKNSSSMYGLEITGTHNFSYLPGFLSGFGGKFSLSLAESDFEFEDSLYGTVFVRELDGSLTQQTVGIVEPGNLPGFSDTVFSGTLYYGVGDFDASLIYKYRSEYFQPYTSNGTRLRYVGDVGVWEARVSYQVNDNFRLTLEGINLFDEPKQTYYFTNDNFGEMNIYGPRIFIGVRGKF